MRNLVFLHKNYTTMKHLKSILVVVLAALVASGCWQPTVFENDFPSYEVNATIQYYMSLNRNNNYPATRGALSASVESNKLTIDMYVWGSKIVASMVDFAQEKGTVARYAELRETFGDFNPERSRLYVPEIENPVSDDALFEDEYSVVGPANGVYACCEKICSLIVTSSADWDAAHPAGAVLNDLFDIDFCSVYSYIKRGFTGDVQAVQRKPLSELAEDDLWLCSPAPIRPQLSALTLPMVAGTHTIFVTLTLATGEQIEYSTDVTFE